MEKAFDRLELKRRRRRRRRRYRDSFLDLSIQTNYGLSRRNWWEVLGE